MQQAFMCSVNMIMPLLLDRNGERTYTFLHQDEYIFKTIQCCLASCANVTKIFLHLSHCNASASPWKWKKRPQDRNSRNINSVNYEETWKLNTTDPKILLNVKYGLWKCVMVIYCVNECMMKWILCSLFNTWNKVKIR